MKVAYLWVKFSPRRWKVGQNTVKRTGKKIFCRFRISNQIFHNIYTSRDIERSLDTTFDVFVKNLNFMDEYLENGASSWPAVFCKCFLSISSTILKLFSKIVRAIFEKIPKNYHFDHIFVLYGWTGFFFKNPAVLRFLTFWYLTTCKVSEKSLAPFLRSQNPPIRTGTRSSIYIPPLTWRIVCIWAQISRLLEKD